MLAQQCALEGHQVMVHLHDKDVSKCFEGLVWKTDDWEKAALESDFTIFDANEHGEKAEMLRAKGVKVWGGSVLADRLENDRAFGMEVLTRAGIPVPKTQHFKNAAEAKALVEAFKDSDRMVIKLDDPKASKSSSYVASDKADMLARIEGWTTTEDDQANLNLGGIVQEFIKGVEISIEGWFDGEDFLYPYNITMEDKKLLNDDKGPNTGCGQNLVKQLKPAHPKLARLLMEPLIPVLKRGRFIGQIDVNCIVDRDGNAFALEFTPRAGYDATPTLVMGLPGYGEAVARALSLVTCNASEGCTCPEGCRCLSCGSERPPFWFLGAVRTYLPPYPFECSDHKVTGAAYDAGAGVEIKGWLEGDEKTKSRVILYDACLEDGKLLTAGTCGIPFVALGHGPDIETMVEDTYKHLSEVKVANLCYRTDLGKKQRLAWPRVEHLLR
jgi:phosphoribosylamine--glycine ligase